MKKQLLLSLCASLLLAGCSGTNDPETSESSEPETETSISESVSIDEEDHTELPELSDITSNISVSGSGYLNDITVGMSLATNSDYGIAFTVNNNPTGVINVYTDNPNVLTVEQSESGTSWTLKTHKAGKSHLIIEDGDTIVHYRKLVTVKKKLTEEEVSDLLYDVDHWATNANFAYFTGNTTIVFMENGTGYMNGTESGGVTLNNESFTYEYDATYTDTAEDAEHWFIYKVSNWNETQFVFDYFAVWNTGDWLHAHTRNSLLGVYAPANEE